MNPSDVAFAFDWTHSGKKDHVAIHRPGSGTFWVVERQPEGQGWQAAYSDEAPGNGIGGHDLKSPQDKLFAFESRARGRRMGWWRIGLVG
jgi:hypothetical protein